MAKLRKQPEVNVGLVGHVDHGKTTLTEALSGRWTDTHSEEIRRGITIRLGYADTEIYKCPKCSSPRAYTTQEKCPHCGSKTEFQRALSFVDAPGHETLMATVLSGAAVMDGAVLVIAANEPCPQPQTREHLMALDIVGVKNIVIVQNKIDVVSSDEAEENYGQIVSFTKETIAEGAPIIPVSAQQRANIDVLIQAIEKYIPTPKRAPDKPPKMFVARSFDINKPGTPPEKLQGGVVGGALLKGELKVKDEIEIKPGERTEYGGKVSWEPIQTQITSMTAGGRFVKRAYSGGLLGIGTQLDPYYTKSDALSGSVLGKLGSLPPLLDELNLKVHLFERVVGIVEERETEPIKPGETLMITVGTTTSVGVAEASHNQQVKIRLKRPVCADKGDRVAISRRIQARWRLIGYGSIT